MMLLLRVGEYRPSIELKEVSLNITGLKALGQVMNSFMEEQKNSMPYPHQSKGFRKVRYRNTSVF